jgi:hypothetical protein
MPGPRGPSTSTPGSTSEPRSLGHTAVFGRFPLDDEVPFEPVVEVYSRPRYDALTSAARPSHEDPRDRAVGLGATPEGGWARAPPEDWSTLVAVVTEEGPVGYGSAFTNVDLVRAALAQLEPLYRGVGDRTERPPRSSTRTRSGSGGRSLTHAISGIDIALWDLFGQATGQPVSRCSAAGTPNASATPRSLCAGRELAAQLNVSWRRGSCLQARLGSVRAGEHGNRRDLAWHDRAARLHGR